MQLDPHAAWSRELDEIKASIPADQDLPDALGDRMIDLHRRILETRALTPGGLLVQVERLAWACDGSAPGDAERAGLVNLLVSLRQLAN